MKIKANYILRIDFILILSTLGLIIVGIFFIYSANITISTGVPITDEYRRQIVWGVAGLCLIFTLCFIDFRRLYKISIHLYIATLLILLYTYKWGRVVNGARAWIGIGTFGIQPSEFAKITTILLLARYLDSSRQNSTSFFRFLVSCIIALVPMGLILIQPDFGTSLVFIPILLLMTFIAGVSMRYIVFVIALITLTSFFTVMPLVQSYILKTAIPVFEMFSNTTITLITSGALAVILLCALAGLAFSRKQYFFWIAYCSAISSLSLGSSFLVRKILKEYQLKRLIVFLDPNVDPQGAGWNIKQSMTAIGSGGFWGKGYLNGTQSHYQFLPQQSTDFIFSIFAEESGFVGGAFVFSLFLLICLRLIRIAKITVDPFGRYISAGLAAVYIFHFTINVGMTMGIMPITGIPLFFMSYGGSALLSSMLGIGLAMSIYIRRFERSLYND
ncbi:MAG: rod shape-determining protein RodA [Spirochaetaceae bacterium]|jgi:rod shape determining protein RodA|nr:rod shape-determining protein RodA [Spirochaetaceae bacterium]